MIVFMILALLWGVHCATIVNFLGLPMMPNKTAEKEHLESLAAQFTSQENGEIEIKFAWANTMDTTAYSTLVQDMLKTKDTSIDIFMIDVVWPGAFADGFLDLAQFDSIGNNVLGHNPAIALNNIVDGRLVALPFFADYGIFYYRKDLLDKYGYSSPPKTWDQMEAIALDIIQREKALGNANLVGYVGQFNSYEGLTCNVMEWLWSHGGGTILNSNKDVTIVNDRAKEALNRVRRWFTNGITPTYARLYDETASLDKWLSGEAIFMRNWPYAISETRSRAVFNRTVGGGFGITTLPGLQSNMTAGTLGGWQLAASRYSQNPRAVSKAMKFLTSESFQKSRAIRTSLLPTRTSLYGDSDVCNAIGNCQLYGAIDVVNRPSTPSGKHYLDVSALIYNSIAEVIRGRVEVDVQLVLLKTAIEKAIGTFTLGPPQYLALGHTVTIMILILTSAAALVVLVMLVLVLFYRERKVIRASGYKFLILILAGVELALVSIFLSSGPPADATCISFGWVVAIGMGLTMGTLLIKTWRIFSIFNNPYQKKAAASDNFLFGLVGIIVAIEIILMGIWTVVDPMKATIVPQTTMNVLVCRCGGFGNVMNIVVYCFNGLLILACLAWSELTKRAVNSTGSNFNGVDFSKFDESTPITVCIYTFSFSGILLVALSNLSFTSLETPYIIRSLIIFLAVLPVMIVFMGPKLRKAINGEDEVATSGLASQRSGTKMSPKSDQASMLGDVETGSPTKSLSPSRFVVTTNRLRLFCLYKYADRASMLQFTSWSMSDIILDDTGVFSMVGRKAAKKPEGKCFQINKSEVTNIVMKSVDEQVYMIECSLGMHVWQFQSDSKSAMEALKTALEAIA
jgi:trehalose/maltose transport system substrate-binding protein